MRRMHDTLVKILVSIDGIKSMADLARQLSRTVTEEAVVGIAFEIDSRSLAGGFGAPLMDVMAGGTGNGSLAGKFARGRINEGKKRPVWKLGCREICRRDRRMMGKNRNLVAGDSLARMAGLAHPIDQGRARLRRYEVPGPELCFGRSIMGEVAGATRSGFRGTSAQDVGVVRKEMREVVLSSDDPRFIWVALGT